MSSAQLCTPSVSLGWRSPHTGTVLCHQGLPGTPGHSEGTCLCQPSIRKFLKADTALQRLRNVSGLLRRVLFWVVQSMSANG